MQRSELPLYTVTRRTDGREAFLIGGVGVSLARRDERYPEFITMHIPASTFRPVDWSQLEQIYQAEEATKGEAT